MKLSKTQIYTLKRLAASGSECPPGGYRNAGRDASRWYRTMGVLARHGLVRYAINKGHTLYNIYVLTDAGREMVGSLKE